MINRNNKKGAQLISTECSEAFSEKMGREFLLLLLPAALLGICPDGYSNLYNGKCFRYFDGPLTFDQARQTCKNDGAELASIHSSEENSIIYSALQGKDHTFLGLYYNGSNRLWFDGTPYDYQNFESSSSVASTSEVVHFNASDGLWHWYPRSEDHAILCLVQQVEEQSGPCELNYAFHEELSLCLRIVSTESSWTQAEDICRADNAHLVSIHGQDFQANSFIRRLALSNNFSKSILIGLQISSGSDGVATPKWSDNSSLDYQNFNQGMPNSIFGDCMAMETRTITGDWISIHCDDDTAKLPFLCAKAPPCPTSNTLINQGDLYSPDYPSSPSLAISCEYFLAARNGSFVLIEFDEMSIVNDDQILLYDGLENDTPFAVVRNDSVGKLYHTPSGNVLRLVYQSGRTPGNRSWHARFGHF